MIDYAECAKLGVATIYEAANRDRYARGERSYDINGLRGVVTAGGA